MPSHDRTTLVLLAAGMGSRYGGVKQMDGVGPNGEAVIDYSIHDALQAGFTVPAERGKPWGTAHAVFAARNAVTTPFAVVNADDFYGRDSYDQLHAHLATRDPGSTDYV